MNPGCVRPCPDEGPGSGAAERAASGPSRALRERAPTHLANAAAMAAPAELTGASRDCTVSVRVVQGLLEAAEQVGIARAQLLEAARLHPRKWDAAETRIAMSDVYRLCELAMDLTRDPAFALHWAERLGDSTFVPISHLIAHSATLRQGFQSLAHFYRLLSDQPRHEVVEHGDKVTVRVLRLGCESLRVQRFCTEMMVVGFLRLLRHFCRSARPERVIFDYPAPPYEAEYLRVFGPCVFFEQRFTGIVFDRALLDAPAPYKDDDVHDALQALAEQRLLRITQRTPYALRVREFLVRQDWRQGADMQRVARALGLSVRSLRRRLADEGKSYSEIESDALATVAKHLLRDKQRTIQETAYEMGFADASSFHRAFKRWTGTTPSAFRQAQHGQHEAE